MRALASSYNGRLNAVFGDAQSRVEYLVGYRTGEGDDGYSFHVEVSIVMRNAGIPTGLLKAILMLLRLLPRQGFFARCVPSSFQ